MLGDFKRKVPSGNNNDGETTIVTSVIVRKSFGNVKIVEISAVRFNSLLPEHINSITQAFNVENTCIL